MVSPQKSFSAHFHAFLVHSKHYSNLYFTFLCPKRITNETKLNENAAVKLSKVE